MRGSWSSKCVDRDTHAPPAPEAGILPLPVPLTPPTVPSVDLSTTALTLNRIGPAAAPSIFDDDISNNGMVTPTTCSTKFLNLTVNIAEAIPVHTVKMETFLDLHHAATVSDSIDIEPSEFICSTPASYSTKCLNGVDVVVAAPAHAGCSAQGPDRDSQVLWSKITSFAPHLPSLTSMLTFVVCPCISVYTIPLPRSMFHSCLTLDHVGTWYVPPLMRTAAIAPQSSMSSSLSSLFNTLYYIKTSQIGVLLLHSAHAVADAHRVLVVLSINPILFLHGHELVSDGFGYLLGFANGKNRQYSISPKPPWISCANTGGSWFTRTQLLAGFLLEASSWFHKPVMHDTSALQMNFWSSFICSAIQVLVLWRASWLLFGRQWSAFVLRPMPWPSFCCSESPLKSNLLLLRGTVFLEMPVLSTMPLSQVPEKEFQIMCCFEANDGF